MSSEPTLQQLIDGFRTASEDDIASYDAAFAALVREADGEELPSILEAIADALSENQPDEHETAHEDRASEPGIEPETAPRGAAWSANRGSNPREFGDVLKFTPRYWAQPKTLGDIVALVNATEPSGDPIDILGAGISTNGLYAHTGNRLMVTAGLDKELQFEPGLYKEDPVERRYHRTEAGISIKKLMDDLNQKSCALNWGGYAPQQLAGAVATSTHKSGFLPPLTDLVLSVEVVMGDGKVYRIEPYPGITVPTAYRNRYPDRELIQDDATFYSAVTLCSVGVIYSVILQAVEVYSLTLEKKFYWNINDATKDAKALLKQQRASGKPWQMDMWVLPKPGSLKTILVIHRKIPHDPTIELDPQPDLWAIIGNFIGKRLWEMSYTFPDLLDAAVDREFWRVASEPTRLDWRNYMGGGIPDLKMLATEMCVDYTGFDDLVALIKSIGKVTKDLYYSSPLGVRFVGASKHTLSMFNKPGVKEFVTLELPVAPHSRDGMALLRELHKLAGRPHWGLTHFMDDDRHLVFKEYGNAVDDYFEIRNELVEGKPDRFRLPRVLRPDKPSPVDPSRRYRIRVAKYSDTYGGYLTIRRHTRATWLSREIRSQAGDGQFFYFTPLDDRWYEIAFSEDEVWTDAWTGSGDLHAIKLDQREGEKSRFRLVPYRDGSGAHRIHAYKEVLGIGASDAWKGYLVRWHEEDSPSQRFWFEDAGPRL